MPIVIISGKQGAGKTTLQEVIADDQYGALVVKFADVLYEMHNAVLDVLDKYWPDRGLKKDGPLLQLLGTEWGRKNIDENVWVKILKKRVTDYQLLVRGDPTIIIDDCRFENEFDAFPEALRIRLECDRETRKARCEMWRENDTHPSEIGLDEYAKKGLFDLYFDTSVITPQNIYATVISVLRDSTWRDKRPKRESCQSPSL